MELTFGEGVDVAKPDELDLEVEERVSNAGVTERSELELTFGVVVRIDLGVDVAGMAPNFGNAVGDLIA